MKKKRFIKGFRVLMCLEFFEVGPNLFWYENEVVVEMASFLWDGKILQIIFEGCRVCLRSIYFVKIWKFFAKSTTDKGKN